MSDYGNHTIRKIVISSRAVVTLAGSAGTAGSADDTKDSARFNLPAHITTDGSNLYVADFRNRTIRKIVIATGTVTTLAGSAGIPGTTDGAGADARFYQPNGITTDGVNLYVTDSSVYANNIRKVVISSGEVNNISGCCRIRQLRLCKRLRQYFEIRWSCRNHHGWDTTLCGGQPEQLHPYD